jgi:hypothetical protein
VPPHLAFTDAEFQQVVAAYRHLKLEPDRPPFFRDFLVRRLRDGSPALADRVALATDDQIERLFTRVRTRQLTDCRGSTVPYDEQRAWRDMARKAGFDHAPRKPVDLSERGRILDVRRG